MKNKALLLHHDYIDMIRKLTVEEAGHILKALYEYDVCGTDCEFEDRMTDLAFCELKKYLDSNRKRYERLCQIKSENAKKQWAALAKAKEDALEMELHAVARNINENINENENANVSVNENESENETAVIREDETAADTHSHKRAYGEFQNVFLSYDQLKRLRQKYPDADYRIETLSAYMKSSGKDYADHYAQLLNWHPFGDGDSCLRKVKAPGERRDPTFDVSAFTQKAKGIKYAPPEEE